MGYYNTITLDSSSLRRLDDALFALSQKAFPELRRDILPELGQVLKDAVDAAIASSIDDSHGHVRDWQEVSYGSGGGYAAIRPKKDEEIVRGRKFYQVALITNALHYGHIGRLPSGKDPNYRARVKIGRAVARKFYTTAFRRVEQHADIVANQIGYRVRQKFTEALR